MARFRSAWPLRSAPGPGHIRAPERTCCAIRSWVIGLSLMFQGIEKGEQAPPVLSSSLRLRQMNAQSLSIPLNQMDARVAPQHCPILPLGKVIQLSVTVFYHSSHIHSLPHVLFFDPVKNIVRTKTFRHPPITQRSIEVPLSGFDINYAKLSA